MQRLAGGLEQLQNLAVIILYIIAHDNRAVDAASSQLQSLDLSLDHVKDVLDDWVESIDIDDEVSLHGSDGEATQAEVIRARAVETKSLLELWLSSWPSSL